MVNLEHELTVDDLIVEYAINKTKNGYNTYFTTGEFMDFLKFFESKKNVKDVLCEKEKLFNRFFERKNKNDWNRKNYITGEIKYIPHLSMEYSEENNDNLIKVNYNLSCYDTSVINTYFMNDKEVNEIRELIKEYLKLLPQRSFPKVQTTDDLCIGKYVTSEIISIIWENYVKENIKLQKWPIQCKDINKYLLEKDLASIIGLISIKDEFLELYKKISKRIAVLYHEDNDLQISSCDNQFLANANYNLLIKGYKKIFEFAFGKYKSSLYIDLKNLEFKESHEIDGVYSYDEDPDIKTSTTIIANDEQKKLVKKFDENIKKKQF